MCRDSRWHQLPRAEGLNFCRGSQWCTHQVYALSSSSRMLAIQVGSVVPQACRTPSLCRACLAGVALASQVGQSVGLALACYATLAAAHLWTGELQAAGDCRLPLPPAVAATAAEAAAPIARLLQAVLLC